MTSFDDLLPSMLARMIRWIGIHSPLYLVWLAGIVFAISRWRRHPTVSLLTLVALAVLLLSSVLGVFVFTWLPQFLSDHGWADAIEAIYSLVAIVLNGVQAIAWGMLLLALFGWRTPTPVAPPYRMPAGAREVGR